MSTVSGCDPPNTRRAVRSVSWSVVTASRRSSRVAPASYNVSSLVLRAIPWSPAVHSLFPRGPRAIVRTVLLATARGAVAVPFDVVVSKILPFAITLQRGASSRSYAAFRPSDVGSDDDEEEDPDDDGSVANLTVALSAAAVGGSDDDLDDGSLSSAADDAAAG